MGDALQHWFQTAWERWREQQPEAAVRIESDPDQLQQIRHVWQCSEFVQNQCQRFDDLLPTLLDTDARRALLADKTVWTQLLESDTEEQLMAGLRRLRNRQMAAIAWMDFQDASVDQTLEALSQLADLCVQTAVTWLYQSVCDAYGVPRDDAGNPQSLIVLAMGKLGAAELNFSSDIDLIFCYPDAGETDGRRAISNEEFFTRLCRRLVKVLEHPTADGFVFRVDTRLRPHGESGPLAMNFAAMEAYYVSQAREWERYAMIKARPLTGGEVDQRYLMQMLRAFVYRRYLDYGVFEAIRKMKLQIEQELRRKDRLQNIKLGPGGIREIEFIGQAFQLIRGGRDRSLQTRGIIDVLRLLRQKEHLGEKTATDLETDYYALRRLENRLQALADQQTHDLPTDSIAQQRLTLAMQLPDWSSLLQQTQLTMQRVHGHFDDLVVLPQTIEAKHHPLIWSEATFAELEKQLHQMGFKDPSGLAQALQYFFQSYSVRSLQDRGESYLERLMPMLVEQISVLEQADETLKLFLDMLERVVTRVSYLVLLVENPGVLQQLIKLASVSPWILSLIARSPILLDELIDPRSLYTPKSRAELEQELQSLMSGIDETDLERQMEELRLFKKANVLRVAACDITGSVPLMIVSDALTEIAEVVLGYALNLAWRNSVERYGLPDGASVDAVSGFCIVAFGKLGGIELGFGSDLDLVFLHRNAPLDEHTDGENPILSSLFYTRLAKRLIHLLTAHTFSGELYEIDLRLRPNGNSGLLVSSLDAFESYQKDNAWTWEHQSLIRARPVAGDSVIADAFQQIRTRTLCRERDAESLLKDVQEMRGKMRENLLDRSKAGFDLKQSPGGIVDIEFIVQFGVLMHANQAPELVRYSDNIRLIEGLNRVGYFTDDVAEALSQAYKALRHETHRAALSGRPNLVDPEPLLPHITTVQNTWQSKLGGPVEI